MTGRFFYKKQIRTAKMGFEPMTFWLQVELFTSYVGDQFQQLWLHGLDKPWGVWPLNWTD